MKIEYLIPLLGIFATIIIAYYTAKTTIKREMKKGKFILLDIVIQYIYIFHNSWNLDTREPKTDKETKNSYLKVLNTILSNLEMIKINPFYTYLIQHYPDLSNLSVFLCKEITSNELSNEIILSNKLLIINIKLFNILKREIGQKSFNKDQTLKLIDNYFKIWNSYLGEDSNI